jgi:prolyl oligopeptidase PreP (S9A serine peptidase family)
MIQKIPMRRAAILALPLLLATHFVSACSQSPTKISMINYPQTKRGDVVEKPFGQTIADPYRWLEDDVRSDKEVAAWVEAQNKVTNAYLDKLPGRDIFKNRLKQLYNYERFTIPVKKGAASQASVENHAVYFHAILQRRGYANGKPQAQDRLVYATSNQPTMVHSFLSITKDGRYVAILSTIASMANKLTVIDLQSADWKPRKLVDNLDDRWVVVGNVGTKLFLITNKDAPRLKVVTMDIAAADPVIADVVPEQDAVLSDASLVSGQLLLSYLVDVKTEVRRYTLDGKADGVVKLPGIGTAILQGRGYANGFEGEEDDKETFFGFTSFNTPGTIYRYDVASNTARAWSEAKVAIDLNQIAVEQRFYTAKDGTRVPMFIVRRKDVTGSAPTLLYAYGGYGLIDPPAFSPERLAWVEQGGVFAIAYIRGGGEYGRAWHEAGRRQNKLPRYTSLLQPRIVNRFKTSIALRLRQVAKTTEHQVFVRTIIPTTMPLS